MGGRSRSYFILKITKTKNGVQVESEGQKDGITYFTDLSEFGIGECLDFGSWRHGILLKEDEIMSCIMILLYDDFFKEKLNYSNRLDFSHKVIGLLNTVLEKKELAQ